MTTIARRLAYTAVQAEYLLARAPLRLIERGAALVPGAGPVQRTAARGVQAVDALGERLLDATAGPASSMAVPSEPDLLPEWEQEEIAEVTDTLLEEQEFAPTAGELADADEAERHRQAELRAKHLVEEQAERDRLEQQRAELAEKAEERRPR